MDKQFLEFWGNMLLQAAQGQAQMENFNRWLSQSGSRVGNVPDLFQQAYGLNVNRASGPDKSPDWQKAFDRFHKAYEDYLALLNVVPLARYQALEAQNAALEDQVAQLKKDLERLGRQSQDAGKGPSEEVMTEFQNLLSKQQREFQTLTDQMSRLWPDRPTDQD
jgi:hypothetical protein